MVVSATRDKFAIATYPSLLQIISIDTCQASGCLPCAEMEVVGAGVPENVVRKNAELIAKAVR